MRYYTAPANVLWLIYTDSSFRDRKAMDAYPHLRKHLDRFQEIITSDNKPYGLHRARDERFFKGEKIIALRKCARRPLFSFSDFDCYVSAAYYVIRTDRLNCKYLLGLLNSRLVAFWLRHRGKMQGAVFQVDKEPIVAMPLVQPTADVQMTVAADVDRILAAKNDNPSVDTSVIESEIDQIVYRLYGLTTEEIAIIEGTSNNKH
jgi:hypothetical protein